MFLADLDEKGGSVYDNFEAAETRRKETLEYLRCCLGSKKPESFTKPTSPLILSFKPIGDSLRKRFTTGKHRQVVPDHADDMKNRPMSKIVEKPRSLYRGITD